jgi:lipid A 3-O-deacylase
MTRVGLLALLVLTWTSAAWAGDSPIFQFGKNADMLEVRMGVLSYDTGALTSKEESGVVINGELVFSSPGFLEAIGSPRPYLGVDFAPDDDQIDFFYAGLNWEAYFTDRLYLSASVGGSINNARELVNPVGYEALGCRALFHVGAGLGFDISRALTVQFYADHFSNANICSENAGAEAAGLRLGYRF